MSPCRSLTLIRAELFQNVDGLLGNILFSNPVSTMVAFKGEPVVPEFLTTVLPTVTTRRQDLSR